MAYNISTYNRLQQYFAEIGKYPLIEQEEEIKLGRIIREKRDKYDKALEKLVNSNLRFVVSVAKRYENYGLSIMDLIQEGNVGLIKAAEKFDERKGYKFISYAVWWIRQAIVQAIDNQSKLVRLPVNKAEELRKFYRAMNRLGQKNLGSVSFEEAAEWLGHDPRVIDGLNLSDRRVESLDKMLYGRDDEDPLYEHVEDVSAESPQEVLEKKSLEEDVNTALKELQPTEAEVVNRYFGLNGYSVQTLEAIGTEFGLTRERVRQIKSKAIRKLGHPARAKILKQYYAEH